MRHFEIFEAPLANYELYGDWSNDQHIPNPVVNLNTPEVTDEYISQFSNSFVSAFDRTLIQKPETEKALKKFFKHLPMPINVFFFNDAQALKIADQALDHGEFHFENLGYESEEDLIFGIFEKRLQERLKKLRSKKAITFVLTQNEGGSKRHPLTPWIIVHRMAHGSGMSARTVYDEIEPFIRNFGNNYGLTSSIIKNRRNIAQIMKSFCTFRSARENNLLDDDVELITELFTQYLVRGTVVLKAPPSIRMTKFDSEHVNHVPFDYQLKNPTRATKDLEHITEFLNSTFEECLQRCQGKIFIS